jgi:hypothetical protein
MISLGMNVEEECNNRNYKISATQNKLIMLKVRWVGFPILTVPCSSLGLKTASQKAGGLQIVL